MDNSERNIPVPVDQRTPPNSWRNRLLADYERLAAPHAERDLPFPVELWAWERLRTALDLADAKTGEERAGWIEDARYWRIIVERLAYGS